MTFRSIRTNPLAWLPVLALMIAAPLCITTHAAHHEQQGTWQLAQERSTLTFHAIKDNAVTVRGTLKASGTVSAGGKAALTVDLTTVDTSNPARDKNIMDAFFETAKKPFATAQVSLDLPQEALDMVKKDEGGIASLSGKLKLHGVKEAFTAKVFLAPATGGVHAVSAEPVEIHIDTWKMAPQLDTLMKLCGHQSVAKPVQVTFDLLFTS